VRHFKGCSLDVDDDCCEEEDEELYSLSYSLSYELASGDTIAARFCLSRLLLPAIAEDLAETLTEAT